MRNRPNILTRRRRPERLATPVPKTIPGLVWWVDGLRVPGVGIGSDVGAWTDQSGHSRHAVQPTTTAKPTRTADGVEFDGTDDELELPAAFSPGADYLSLVVVLSFESSESEQHVIGKTEDNDENLFQLRIHETNSIRFHYTSSGSIQRSTGMPGPSVSPGQPVMVGAVRRVAEGTITYIANGSTSTQDILDRTPTNPAAGVTLGQEAGGGRKFTGTIHEAMLFDGIPLEAQHIARLNHYCQTKWGTP